jgi:hypothetical protein
MRPVKLDGDRVDGASDGRPGLPCGGPKEDEAQCHSTIRSRIAVVPTWMGSRIEKHAAAVHGRERIYRALTET